MDNIILICNEKAACDALKSNLMLLRQFDSIVVCDFISAEKTINQNNPKLIILYSSSIDKKILLLIQTFKNIPILFVTDDITDESLLSVYEAGIADYIFTNKSKTEFLIKTMLCLKRGVENQKNKRNADLLTQIGILKKGTDFFSPKYTPAVFKTLIKKLSKNKLSIMAISPDIDIKNQYNLDYLASNLKKFLRKDDIIGFKQDKIYILLPNTNKQGALDVYNKFKKSLEAPCTISAGILEIEKSMTYDFISQKVDEALSDALLLKNSVVVQEDFTSGIAMNWLDKSNKKHKNFKLFKKALMKKIETAIAPVFYQKQQIAEQRLFEVEIEQYCNEKESRFTLKKEGVCSIFELTYPGAVKIDLYIYKNVYENSTPEYQSFELPKVNEKLISDLLDKFIKEFGEK